MQKVIQHHTAKQSPPTSPSHVGRVTNLGSLGPPPTVCLLPPLEHQADPTGSPLFPSHFVHNQMIFAWNTSGHLFKDPLASYFQHHRQNPLSRSIIPTQLLYNHNPHNSYPIMSHQVQT